MKRIVKGQEPGSLTQYRQQPNSSYEDYQDKETLRQFLVAEQKGLCCYCLSRIRPNIPPMKIEHWHSQKGYPEEQLVYANMLGACLGNEGQPYKLQHCDTRKGDADLSRNPSNPQHYVDDLIHFEGDGTISSQDISFDNELNKVLNLNVSYLKNQRKAVLDAFKATLSKRGELRRTTLERWLREWNGSPQTAELRPYCQVVVYWLRKRLARA
ncbi:MAG: TIGR02646 family protein [Candidatus Angelobacter sp. Gp1-AA117]|nr:MAG: TIGR02646 family protein [Candidatus Angelobacter sp. Gp1-AA117]